ncbi:MAG: OmpA family protein, partial [Pseudomonadota bacterium]
IQRQLFEQLIGDIARIQIGFEVNEIDLDNVALQRIDELTNSLKDAFQLAEKLNLDANLIIVGASDSSGVSSTNERLSLQRANNVKTALINNGIPVSRLFSTGIGEIAFTSDVVATRRVMFNVLYTQTGQRDSSAP